MVKTVSFRNSIKILIKLSAELLRADRRLWASHGITRETGTMEAKPVADLYPPVPLSGEEIRL